MALGTPAVQEKAEREKDTRRKDCAGARGQRSTADAREWAYTRSTPQARESKGELTERKSILGLALTI